MISAIQLMARNPDSSSIKPPSLALYFGIIEASRRWQQIWLGIIVSSSHRFITKEISCIQSSSKFKMKISNCFAFTTGLAVSYAAAIPGPVPDTVYPDGVIVKHYPTGLPAGLYPGPGLSSRATNIQKRGPVGVYICHDKNFTGACVYVTSDIGQCGKWQHQRTEEDVEHEWWKDGHDNDMLGRRSEFGFAGQWCRQCNWTRSSLELSSLRVRIPFSFRVVFPRPWSWLERITAILVAK